MTVTRQRRAFLLVYSLSGAAGLVYEVAWTRMLTLQLGHTVAAASTVLAAFMGGLAVGAWLAGRWAPALSERSESKGPSSRLLRTYAVLEIAVAVAALLLPLALRASVPLLAWAYADADAPARFAFVRVLLSLGIVGVPAAAMGATFPIAAAAIATTPSAAGLLYATNTAGAALGAVAAGFWLIPALGLRGTTWVGVALNLAAAGGAWLLTKSATAENAESAERRSQKQKDSLRSPRAQRSSVGAAATPRLALFAVTVSGFAALAYEVAWTRLLALVLGPTTYAFATMAAAFIAGLAMGSAAGSKIARQSRSPGPWLGVLLIAGALAANATAWFAATQLPLVVANEVIGPAADFASVVLRQAALVLVVLMPMTVVLGATFPVALAAAGGPSIAATAAMVYAANTVGAIAGALVAGFLLIPAIGLQHTIEAAAAFTVVAGALCFRRRWLKPAVAAAALGALALVPAWDRALLASGAYKYAPYVAGTDLEAVFRTGALRYYKEGAAATVSVRDLAGTRSLSIDGKVDASNGGDMLTQRLLGLLPVMIHGNARDVAIIGLGSGVTAGSALAAGTVQLADVIEISPEVVDASRFFDRESGSVLGRPGVRVIVADGRSHLLLARRSYDVIVSEPSNPWMAGVASLFTREFFEAAKSRLRPGGILCQWAHTYDIRTEDLRSIVRTFASAFPEGTMWLVGGGDLLLIGAKGGGIERRLDSITELSRRDSIRTALTDVGVAPQSVSFSVLSLFAGGGDELARFGKDAVVQTDDRTPLEYSAPRGIYGHTKEDNVAILKTLQAKKPDAVRAAFDAATDADWASRGAMDLRAQAFASSYDAFREAVLRNARNSTALAGLSDAAGATNHLHEEQAWLEATARREPTNAAVRIELSRVRAVQDDGPGAVQAATEALQMTPDDPRAAEQLASVYADTSDLARLGPFSEALAARFPNRIDAKYYRASALFMSGRTEDAVSALRHVVDTDPTHARAQSLLGSACANLGRRECAQTAFDAAIQANPHDPAGYITAGLFHLRTANASSAAVYFATALAISPSSEAAKQGLAQARAMVGLDRSSKN